MSDQPKNAGQKPLFQQMDAQEQVYAPDQVPGDSRTAADEHGSDADQSGLVPGVIPAVPAGGITGTSTASGNPALVPVVPMTNELDEEDRDSRRDL